MGRPLKAKYSGALIVGVQEMSDVDISDLILPLVVANWSGLSEVSGPSGSVVRSYSSTVPSYNYISRGTAVNTETDSIGTHPRTTSTTTTYTVVQNEFNPGLSTTAGVRPIQQTVVGNEVKISAMSNQDIINDVMPVIVNSISTGGQGAYYLGLTSAGAPATGTWVTVSNLTDNFYNASNVYQSISYTLWLRTSGGSVGTIRPLTITNTGGGETRFTEMTNSEVEQLASFVGEYIRTTGIGKYNFSVSAPGAGTWVSRGSYTDTVNNLVDTAYVGTYVGTFSGAFTGGYTGAFTGSYVGYYTGVYSGNYTGIYAGTYVGTFAGSYNTTYADIYSRTWTGSYAGNYSGFYSGNYTGGYVGNFAGAYVGTYLNFYLGYYVSSYTGVWAVTNPATFAGAGFIGYYAGAFVRYRTVSEPWGTVSYTGYYVSNFAGAYTSSSAGTYVGYYTRNTLNPSTGIYYASGPYVGYYTGNYGSSVYTGSQTLYYTGVWSRNFAGGYTGNFTGSYTGNYQTVFVGTYAGSYLGAFIGTYVGSYQGLYIGYYTRAYTGNYSRNFSGTYAGTYAGAYAGTYAGAYVGTYNQVFTGVYNNTFSRTFTGSYSGLTVQLATTTTTYTLWVRTA
jgi:hypothetical protein